MEPLSGPHDPPATRSLDLEALFEKLPISVWIEDFSRLKVIRDDLAASGVTDFRKCLESDEALVFACLESVKVLAVNRETLRLHGADSREDLLEGLQSTFTPRSFEVFREELIALFEGSGSMVREAEVQTLKGQLREVTVCVSLDDSRPDWSRAYVVLADISEQKRAQRELQSRERLHEEIERVGKIGGWSIDAETREMRWTDEVFHIFGMQGQLEPSIEEAMAQYSAEAREVLTAALEQCLKSGVPYDIELPFESRNGQQCWTRSVGHAEIENGRVKRASGTLQDITSRRMAEDQRLRLATDIQHNQKLKSLGALAGGIAHDFNNILSVVIGNAELARADAPSGGRLVHQLDEILSAARRAARLAGQMLSYSGRSFVSGRPIELNAYLSEILAMLRIAVPKNTALCFEAAPDLPVVFTDPDQVQQLLLNLVLNATEAFEDGEGLIDVRLGRAYLSEEELSDLERRFPLGHGSTRPAGEFIVIHVRDDGCGMEPETISQIFDPFYTTKFTGRGLAAR